MDIKEFDLLLLKNGKKVVVMDIYDDGKAFEVEPKPGKDGRPPEGEPMTYAIQLDEIERKIS